MQGCCVDGSCATETCMSLPSGSACGQCYHWKRCSSLGYSSDPHRTECDFFPRAFCPMGEDALRLIQR